ncbi:MAG: hypothetical protein JWQ21_2514 [Herminiimonas sp.]|nr:hypothetical protein [Herminiimonas sp.]
MPKTLTIIGGGNLGKTLGRLWTLNRTFTIQNVLNRFIGNARAAVSFIGAGHAAADYADLLPADIYLIATPDDQIVQCCEKLARAGCLSSASIVFHCSGALRSSELQPALQLGAAVASIHPIRSFASPEQVVQSFAGTCCGIEGDRRALDVLSAGFTDIGAQLVAIDADFKMLYHSAAVFASNYLATLLDVALQTYAKAGIPNDAALRMIEPLVRKTVDNIFRLGPEKALSGPIARGDLATAVRQYKAVKAWDKRYGALYKQLGRLTADLAARRDRRADDSQNE